MIVFKMWITQRKKSEYSSTYIEETYHAWYLFGFIPLYVKMVKYREY